MAPIIYKSAHPDIELVETSIFTHFLGVNPETPDLVGHHPGDWRAFIDSATDTTLTRADLRSLSLKLGYGIRNHPNIQAKRGDTALVFSPNSILFPVVVFGTVGAGLRVTFANVAYGAREIAHQFVDSGAKFVYTTEDGIPVIRQMLKDVNVEDADKKIIVLPRGFKWAGGPDAPRSPAGEGLLYLEDILGMGSLDGEEKFDGKQTHETVYLCYSSGTTGKPKGVETTHQNLTSNVDMTGSSFPDLQQRTAMGVIPMFHIFGSVNLVLMPLRLGFATVVLPRFDPVAYCANIEKYKVAFSLIVPPILVMLARHPVVEKYDLSSLKMMVSGAAPLAPALAIKVMERFRAMNTFCSIVQGYGLTEASPVALITPYLLASEENLNTSGTLVPSVTARLMDEEGNDVPEGEAGELWLQGPNVMKGYLNNAEATAHTITEDAWLKTGDVAIRDSKGFFSIVDRLKELIKYKGFQVPPAELEHILCSHPEIADAAVVAVYDDAQATELPRAYIVPATSSKLDSHEERTDLEKDVQLWMKGQVAYHKHLRGGVVAIAAVPKNASGKILRGELRERAKTEVAAKV